MEEDRAVVRHGEWRGFASEDTGGQLWGHINAIKSGGRASLSSLTDVPSEGAAMGVKVAVGIDKPWRMEGGEG